MKMAMRGAAVAVLQCALVLTVAGKYALDRERLPRVWAMATPVDPYLPVRGRYVSLRLRVEGVDATVLWTPARLAAVDGRLVATPDPQGTVHVMRGALTDPVAFFIPENVPDPSRRPRGEELWVEVSVPQRGLPRPIRLGLKKDGVIAPLPLR